MIQRIDLTFMYKYLDASGLGNYLSNKNDFDARVENK
jgi:hypothetical protein